MNRDFEGQLDGNEEGATANLHSTRVREVFKYLPDWAPKTEDSATNDAVLSPDVTLNALAQTVALRLNVDRSLISFLDGQDQYVLAEATKTSSLQKARPAKTENFLLTGMRTIASGDGLCYQALAQVPVDGILVVENIHEHQDFCFRPFTQSAPDVRFYAACPIVINDEKVGIICVIDQHARSGFSSEEINFLSDIATAVARHLESLRLERTQARSRDIVGALNAVMKPGQKRSPPQSVAKGNQAKSSDRLPVEHEDIENGKEIDDQSTKTPLMISTSQATALDSSSNFLDYAGSLLVNGFNADGVVFYDAGSRAYTSGLSRRGTGYRSPDLGSPTSPEGNNFPASKHQIMQGTDSPACKVLAFSDRREQFDYPPALGSLQEQNLRDLLELYPTGKVLHEGDIEITPNHGTSQPQSQTSEQSAEMRVEQCLSKSMPEAQSIVFFPLWDHCRERWYAGGFLWSSDAKRLMFTEEDLNFLRVFALVLTGELASRDRERSHSQKETFISMISHELRTPLHGILSNVDLMKDIGLTTFQTTLLDTISACGHSLMDIINHLIDRSTMVAADAAFKKHHQMNKKHGRASLMRTVSYDTSEEVDLVVTTEEVISALAAEMHLRVEARQGYEAALHSSNSTKTQDLLPSHAVVVYDIYPQHNWLMRIRKGAFRRLLANLTSNAIKFTREGTIQISLQRQDRSKDSLACTVTLEVEDTGEGISSDFLEHHMFQQFQQENSRTIGSGLGLYIVKSMTDELGGQVNVRSSKGNGTFVSISFPCDLVDTSTRPGYVASTDYADPVLQQIKSAAHNFTACFISTNEDQRSVEVKSGLEHSKESLSRVCRNWFGINIETLNKLKSGPGIINFVDESFLDSRSFSDVLLEMDEALTWTESGKSYKSPVIFIGTVNFTAALQRQPKFEAKEYMFSVTNPCGPHQLARVLKSCMDLMSSESEPERALSQLESQVEGITLSAPPERLHTEQSRTKAVSAAQPHLLAVSVAAETTTKLPNSGDGQMPTPMNSPWKRKPHMLLVEDNAINMKVLERLCKRLSLSYALAFNGLEAVKLFQDTPNTFDIVWMDIMMPVMDGIAATKQIRDIERKDDNCKDKSRVRVVALTGLSGEDIENDAASVGFDAFWTKPVKLDLLKKEVDQWAQLWEEQVQ